MLAQAAKRLGRRLCQPPLLTAGPALSGLAARNLLVLGSEDGGWFLHCDRDAEHCVDAVGSQWRSPSTIQPQHLGNWSAVLQPLGLTTAASALLSRSASCLALVTA